MKRLFLMSAVCFATAGWAQVKMPAPSPTQTLKQDFGLSSIEVTYSRPATRGRKVMGDLVPYNKLWRTGANAATLIRFHDDVMIKGKKIDSGSYVIYTIPHEESWDIILNKGLTNWGASGYTDSLDVARFTVESKKIKPTVENFTIQFTNITPSSCELQLSWENTMVSLPIAAQINDRIRSQIEAALQTDKKPYWQAAQFYHEYEKNDKKALDYVTEATQQNPKAYWIWLYKAKIEHAMGNKTAAMASSKKSLELAKEDQNDDYIKMNEELQSKLK